jgi:hypothetical protein
MDYRFKRELTEEKRQRELKGMLKRGNHKSMENGSNTAEALLAKDVSYGFSIPVSPTL